MPLPRWLAHINKRVLDPIEVRRGARPVLIHTDTSLPQATSAQHLRQSGR